MDKEIGTILFRRFIGIVLTRILRALGEAQTGLDLLSEGLERYGAEGIDQAEIKAARGAMIAVLECINRALVVPDGDEESQELQEAANEMLVELRREFDAS